MSNRTTADVKLIGFCAVICAAILVGDLLIPLGVAAGVPYVAPVLIASWASDRRYTLLLAAIGSALTVVGYFYSSTSGLPWMVLANRGLALFAIWVTAVLAYKGQGVTEALRESERHAAEAHTLLLDAIENISDGFILYDADERFILCNSRYREFYPRIVDTLVPGAKLEERTRKAFDEGAVIDTVDNAEERVRVRLEQHRSASGTHEQHLSDGRWLLCHERRSSDGNTVGIRTDITELKRREQGLRESEERYAGLFENSPVGIWEEDFSQVKAGLDELRAAGIDDFEDYLDRHPEIVEECVKLVNILGVNQAALQMLETEDKETLLPDLSLIFTDGAYEGFKKELIAIWNGVGRLENETELRTLAGSKRQVVLRWAVAPGAEETFSRVLVTVVDITDRKRAEKALRKAHSSLERRVRERTSKLRDANKALEIEIAERERATEALRESEELFAAFNDHTPTKIHIKDLDGRYILINRQSENLFRTTEDEAQGKLTDDLFHEEQAERFRRHDEAVLASGQAVEAEEEFLLEDGVHTFLTVKFPIFDREGKAIATGAIGTDITERKRTEIELRLAKEEAEYANRAKSEFLANMSHELRTPLNAIMGFSEMIHGAMFGPVGDPKYLEYAADINSSSQHLLDLINDILDLSRIEAGKVQLNEELIDFNRLIDSCLILLKERAQNSNLEVEKSISGGLPTLWADERKIKQILINLLSNAVKFTPPGGKVSVGGGIEPDGSLAINVSDTGIGIAQEDIPGAMDPFSQVDSDLSRKFEGAGLGLPLARSLVEMHGGSLDLQSEVGVGTTVTVRFPAERIKDQAVGAV